jgi:hypothetical protein
MAAIAPFDLPDPVKRPPKTGDYLDEGVRAVDIAAFAPVSETTPCHCDGVTGGCPADDAVA